MRDFKIGDEVLLLLPTEYIKLLMKDIVNGILSASDANPVSILTLLDLSAAFDTVDHSIQHLNNILVPLVWPSVG